VATASHIIPTENTTIFINRGSRTNMRVRGRSNHESPDKP
jgi:hypothetical protein